MARATGYEQEARAILENAAKDGDALDVGILLDRLCNRLHDHDGWADWREIHASVYQASYEVCLRRRRPVWAEIRQALTDWRIERNVNVDHARV